MGANDQYIVLRLSIVEKYNLSVFEAVLLERINFFATNPESKCPGWCYASRTTLAKELNVTKRGIQKCIQRLVDLGLLETDEKGWIRCFIDDEQSSPPMNFIPLSDERSSPNNTIDNNIVSNNNSLVLLSGEQSSPSLELISPQQNKVPSVRKKGKTYLDDASFDQLMIKQGKEQVKIGYGLVYLRRSDYEKFVNELGREMTHEMILQLDIYKSQNKFFCGKQRFTHDERTMRQAWVLKNAKDALYAKNSNIVHELKKTEKAQDKIKKLWLDQ